jgi:pimeloyl-ACP methyl ester carboxylesterase
MKKIITWQRVVLGVLALVVLAVVGTEFYATYQADIQVETLAIEKNTEEVVIIVHGLGDDAEGWPRKLERRMASFMGKGSGCKIITYDWNPYSLSSLRSSTDGTTIGRALGKQLAEKKELTKIHLIGHSVGSFVIDALCKAYKESAEKPAQVRMTFLDPFCMKGTINWWYGQNRFGACGDFTEAYVNTDDPVPTTNERLIHAYNFDVTGHRSRSKFKGEPHWWPVDYVTNYEDPQQLISLSRDHERFPRGDVQTVP